MKVILWKILIYKKFLVIMLASLPACQLASLPAYYFAFEKLNIKRCLQRLLMGLMKH